MADSYLNFSDQAFAGLSHSHGMAGTTPSTVNEQVQSVCIFCYLDAKVFQPLSKEHARRHAAGLRGIQDSPEVRAAAEALAWALAFEGLAQIVPKIDPVLLALDLLELAFTSLEAAERVASGDKLYGSVQLINAIATFLQNKIAERYGVPLPIGQITNLAGTIWGVYLYSYATG